MIDILSSVQVLLREVGFGTRLVSAGQSPVLRFEDESLMGFVITFEDSEDMLKNWKTAEMSLLTQYASRFRQAGDKAWNVYVILLTTSAADSNHERQVRWIEEDLERTRKLASCGVTTREDLVRALLPILPLQYKPMLQTEDVSERLQRRIRSIAPKAAEVALNESVPVAEVVPLLEES
jgi:hypothetical protein